MPNLVGIGLSQVPTNSMLGGMAYQDPEHASIKELNLKNLSQINSEISDTASDVFVYDTHKDSDGGAWRKRTQNTSWYNETLGTATRGTRREFPAVAVIVADSTSDKLTIYDGDDPDLPMWMVFSAANPRGILGWATSNMTSIKVTALNGILVAGTNDSGTIYKFVEDFVEIMYSSANYQIKSGRTIADRNNAVSYDGVSGTASRVFVIDHYKINDVAITVQPNAPIDDATGLPFPTIAVATSDGASIIRDDGIVINKATTAAEVHQVDWMSPSRLLMTAPLYYGIFDDPFSSESAGYLSNINDSSYYGGDSDGNSWNHPRPIANLSTTSQVIATDSRTIVAATSSGLNIHELSTKSSIKNNDGIVAYATSSYNTGYQLGDIKGTFLSDTVTEKDNVNYALSGLGGGTSRLTSLTYNDGDTAWQMVDNASSANGYLNINLAGLTIGQTYKITMTWDNNAALDSGYQHRVAHKNGTADENNTNFTHWNKTNGSSEVLIGVFTAQSVNDDDLIIYANAITLNISNFKVEETDDINGVELVTNGTFDSNVSSWSTQDSSNTHSSGKMQITRSGGGGATSYQAIKTLSGVTYIATAEVNSSGSRGDLVIKDGTGWSGTTLGTASGTAGQTKILSVTFTATSATTSVAFSVDSNNTSIIVDDVSVRLAESDRTYNNNSLRVIGTIFKTPVATGAELAAYSGLNDSNYLEQPYNTDLNFGTGDFSLMNWIYVTAGGDYQVVFDRWSPSGGNARFYWGLDPDEKLIFHHREDNSSNATDLTGSTVLCTGVWHHMAAVRRGSNVEVYLNGKLDSLTLSSIRNVTPASTKPILRIGTNAVTSPSDPMLSKIALLRISGDAPSKEQIKKIYQDEKHLFQENAACTLYGTSSDVKALAYDDSTNLLYAGTSSGRSEFQGLCRINNTTTAVTTAISASNELVAEQ